MLRLKLRCPRCKNTMLYQSQDQMLTDKKKQCVYCGRTYSVKDNIVPEKQ